MDRNGDISVMVSGPVRIVPKNYLTDLVGREIILSMKPFIGVRVLQKGDRVSIAVTGLPERRHGDVVLVHTQRSTARVEWDGSTIDKTDPAWRQSLLEIPVHLLRYEHRDRCPECMSPLQLTTAEKRTSGVRLDGGDWRVPVAVLACSGCEYVEEI